MQHDELFEALCLYPHGCSQAKSHECCSSRQNTSAATLVTIYDSREEPPPRGADAVRFVAISDTHTQHKSLRLPDGDVLLHLGDFTNTGTLEECEDFCNSMASKQFKQKLLVPGNHDLTCDAGWYDKHWSSWHESYQSTQQVAVMLQAAGITVLNGQCVTFAGVNIYGNSVQPRQPKSRPQMAFGRIRGAELKAEWAQMPTEGVDLLLTHTPPAGILDMSSNTGTAIGCEELKKAVARLRPAVHVFGHVHAGYGVEKSKHTLFINASSATQRQGEGGLLNPPIVFDIEKQLE